MYGGPGGLPGHVPVMPFPQQAYAMQSGTGPPVMMQQPRALAPSGRVGGRGRLEWFELREVSESDNIGIDPVRSVAFDPHQELVWSGLKSGRVVSYLSPPMERYTSFVAHAGEVKALLPHQAGVLSLSSRRLRFHSRGGLPLLSLGHEDMVHMSCATFTSSRQTELLVAGEAPAMFLFDIEKGELTRSIPLPAPLPHSLSAAGVTALARSRLICCGGLDGQVTLRDPNQLQIQQTLQPHTGGVSDVAIKGDLLVTCGWSQSRAGKVFIDQVVKAFDLRTMRQLNPVPFPAGPHLLKFHPKFSSTLLVMSQRGQFQLCDIQGDPTNIQFYEVDTKQELLSCFDIASTGEVVCLGDTGGRLRQWSDREDIRVNDFSQPTQLVRGQPPVPRVSMDDTSPLFLSTPYPPVTLPLLSDWPLDMSFPVARPPRMVPRRVQAEAKRMRFFDFTTNHFGLRRNCELVTAPEEVEKMIDIANGTTNDVPVAAEGIDRRITARKRRPPKKYRKYEIKRQAYNSEDINVSPYNKTKFGGLDNTLSDSYCNAAIQTLYFMPTIRRYLKGHLCREEFCLTCELGFLFHMMDISNGRICTNANFLRALRHTRAAADAGLLLSDDGSGATASNSGSLIERFFAFVLEHLSKEALENTSRLPSGDIDTTKATFVMEQLGSLMVRTVYCTACRHSSSANEIYLHHRMAYPKPSASEAQPTFAEVLKEMIDSTSVEERMCSNCNAVQPLQVRHQIRGKLPEYLSLCANVLQPEHLQHWLRGSFGGSFAGGVVGEDAAALGEYPLQSARKWLPLKLSIGKFGDRLVVEEKHAPEDSVEGASNGNDQKTAGTPVILYELTAVISQIKDPAPEHIRGRNGGTPHFIAHIRANSPSAAAAAAAALRTPRTPRGDDSSAGLRTPSPQPPLSPRPHPSPIARVMSPASTEGLPLPQVLDRSSDSLRNSSGGLVSHSPSSQWYLVNDFCITPAFVTEVCQFYQDWKHPAYVVFTRTTPPLLASSSSEELRQVQEGLQAGMQALSLQNQMLPTCPIDDSVFFVENPLAGASMQRDKKRLATQLSGPEDLPGAGELAAIDTEFVSLQPPETMVKADGKQVVLKQGRYGLARVSVIYGGEKEIPVRDNHRILIDDYIASREPISDYLTRFSGITAGDLDPVSSPYEVTTLKATFLKLRRLVDRGCIFVGHGLQKDFRIINLMVPKEQVIDTVELFHLPHQRNLSLRFLAAQLLDLDIQAETHCSIEDARTALLLYVRYLELVRTGQLTSTLQHIYHVGRQTGWALPSGPQRTPTPQLI